MMSSRRLDDTSRVASELAKVPKVRTVPWVPMGWCRVPGAGCRVPGAGCRVPGAWCLVPRNVVHRALALKARAEGKILNADRAQKLSVL